MSNPLNHKWVIQSSDGVMDICVPQCCDEWANISIGYEDDYKRSKHKNNSILRKVYLPSFKIDKDGGKSFGEMDFSIYEKYLHANKVEITALVERLNAAQDSVPPDRLAELAGIILVNHYCPSGGNIFSSHRVAQTRVGRS